LANNSLETNYNSKDEPRKWNEKPSVRRKEKNPNKLLRQEDDERVVSVCRGWAPLRLWGYEGSLV